MALATVTPSIGVSLYRTTKPQSGPTLGDLGGAVGRLDKDIATLGAQSRGDSLSQSVNTLEEVGTGFNAELELLFTDSQG